MSLKEKRFSIEIGGCMTCRMANVARRMSWYVVQFFFALAVDLWTFCKRCTSLTRPDSINPHIKYIADVFHNRGVRVISD